jgi:hypothetical protein
MNLFKKHVDTVVVLGGILSSVFWMNHKFTQVDEKFTQVYERFAKVDLKFAELEKDMAVMKAVLMVKDQFPKELMAVAEEK